VNRISPFWRGGDNVDWVQSEGVQVVFWDTVTGVRLRSFDKAFLRFEIPPKIDWAINASYAVVQTRLGAYLWRLEDNSTILLDTRTNVYYQTLLHIHFDLLRGQLLAVPAWYGGNGGVIVYDLISGQNIAYYDNKDRSAPVDYLLSNDNRYIVVFSDESDIGSGERGKAGVTIWDRDNSSYVQIDVGERAAYSTREIAISPNNRYLVIGKDALRIWDLETLSANVEDRDPIYRHGGPNALITSVRFVDNNTTETFSDDGVQRWDLQTGIYIPAE
jgi:WD40 repeat protein